MSSDLSCLFNGQSLAVIGATTHPEKLGYQVLKNIIEGGYRGKIYAVNQKGGTVMGLSCYKSLSEIKETPELIVVIVPNKLVPGVIRDAGARGVKAAIVISGGFGESGNNELEQELMEAAKQYNVRIQGPNCQGLTYKPNFLCASWPLVTEAGHISVIAQSGTVGAEVGIRAQQERLGVSAIVSLGNKCDVNELDFLEYFAQDPNTHAIGLYLEGITNGKRFIEMVKNITLHKPVVTLKAGRTAQGRNAVASHTKSLAGKSEVFDGLCKQYGIINAKNITEFYDLLKGFAHIKPSKGKKVLIVTSSGGSGALATDEISEAGLDLVKLAPQVESIVKGSLAAHCVVKNPVDLTGDATAEMYEDIVLKAAQDDNIDTLLVIFGDPYSGVGEAMCRVKDQIKQNLIICYLGGDEVQVQETYIMHKKGIPVFNSPESAVRVIKELAEYGEYLWKNGCQGDWKYRKGEM